MRNGALSLLLVLCAGLYAAERKTTDVIIVIKVPQDTTVGAIKPLRPADITALRKESNNIYLPDTDEFLCIMTVAVENAEKMRDAIKAYKVEVVEEITPEKEAVLLLTVTKLVAAKALVEENVEFAGETKEEYMERKGFVVHQ